MWLALAGVCATVLSLAGMYLYLDPQIPRAETYRHVKLETPLRVYTADARLIAEFGERRLIPVTLAEVPGHFISALLDTEDKRFYEHNGVDFVTLTTAALDLVMNMGEISRGGSTITMQLPRNLGTFSRDQVFIRKFKEILLALKMERELSKDEILELYINAVPFGKRAYGAQAAAYTYYGKPLAELTLAQLAMLAGIPQAPTAGNPINGPERSINRRNLVLRRMLEQRSITPAEFDVAVAAPITARLYARELDVPAPYAAEWVRQQLIRRLPDLYSGGYEVYTSLQSELQAAADSALRKGLLSYDRRHGYRGPEAQLMIREDEPLDDTRIQQTLAEMPLYGNLEAAVVKQVDENAATVQLAGRREVVLDLDAVRWARSFIDVDTRGPVITRVTDVLGPGDLIRVEYLGKVAREIDDSQAAEAAAATGGGALASAPVTEVLVDAWRLAQLPEIQGALVSLNPDTGAVLALSGGFDFGMNQYNHAIQAARQPGSGFKPFVYSAALNSGVTPASIFMDAPLVFDDKNLESEYRPDNDNNQYNGPTRLRVALYRSINLVSMRVLLDVGAGNVLSHAQRFGFDTSTFPRNTQLAVGGGTMAVTPLQMASAYAIIANGGWKVEPNLVTRVVDITGTEVFKPMYSVVCRECSEDAPASPASEEPSSLEDLLAQTAEGGTPAAVVPPAPRTIDARNAWIMNNMLQDVIKRGTGRRAAVELQRSDIAGKTGTTNDAADTWFNGYNPDVVTTVWVGFPNHQALGSREYGSNTPLPIWIDYMKVALADRPQISRPQPPGIVTRKINPRTGELASAQDSDAIFEYFLQEHVPTTSIAERRIERKDDEIKAVDIF
ncbi:MAG: PBP1A family penicillin-binding protein [Pseudomonadales bacterium]